MSYNDAEKYELNGPPNSDYGATWEDDPDTQAFVDKEIRDSVDIGGGSVDVQTPYESPELYFSDRTRKIDFVLVYEEQKQSTSSNTNRRSARFQPPQEEGENKVEGGSAGRHERWRTKFLGNLAQIGLDMEEEVVESTKSITHFLKLHARWDILVHFAEELNFRAPLQAYQQASEPTFVDRLPSFLKVGNLFEQNVPCKPIRYYTCPFKKSKIDKFLGHENRDTFFTNTQRSRIVYEILETSIYGKRHRAEIGIDRLIQEGAFMAAYPLHEGPYVKSKKRQSGRVNRWNRRQVLFAFWAKWSRFYTYQPLDHIREYFGEKVAFYFAWLGFYTGWLIPAAFVGIMVFLYGVYSMHTNPIADEICNSGEQYKMCPRCNEDRGCSYYYLSDVCSDTRRAYLFDHPGTVFYAIFISFWSVLFLEFWKRRSVSLAHYWDCLGMDTEERPLRPQFVARASYRESNPVTGLQEPAFPKAVRIKRMVLSMGVVMAMMCLVIIFIIALILYRTIISIPLFQNPNTRPHASGIASYSGAIIQLIVIMILGKVYTHVARQITDWEMHRSEEDYEYHLTLKVFIFQFVNFYSAVIYIAFIKGRFTGYPGNYRELLGLRPDDCQAGGCLAELAHQLAVIMIGKQIFNNTIEIFVPKIKSYFRRRRMQKSRNKTKTQLEEDYELLSYGGLLSEYMEMVIQFGFITIFVVAFPLAPVLALINNWVEIRLDAHKLICETRRVVSFRGQDIGIWFTILETLAQLAVIANAFLIAFTTDFIPRILYQHWYSWNYKGYVDFTLAVSPKGNLSEECRYFDFRDDDGTYSRFYWAVLAVRLAFVVIFQLVVFSIARLIKILVPDIPRGLDLKIRRENYLAKRALVDNDNVLQVNES